MAASPGTYLGPYEVLSPLGAGGMGEVYCARDGRLGREVAVKVLPDSYSEDADRLARFEQEARAAGGLNHPNILAIYDIGRQNGFPYIVSELLEGETLREKLHGSPLPQRKAVDYALQIACGLAAAHEKGIIHRDLKPENLFITKDGYVKILDFGLAKLAETNGDQPQSEISTRRVDTGPGVLIGTVGYMSPEQVNGHAVDHRSDIFSFGAILYEMLSGNRAFHGESPAATMSAILKEDPPDLSETNKHVSVALERLLDHCLAKSPDERFQSARDLAFALESLSGSSTSLSEAAAGGDFVQQRPGVRALIPWAIAVVLLATALGLAYLYIQRSTNSSPTAVTRFRIDPPERSDFLHPPIVSPDGRRVVLNIRDASGKNMLWTRALDSLDAQPLPGTEGANLPFWSSDSRSVGFYSVSRLNKVEIGGGPAQSICDVNSVGGGATWGPDGTIVFTRGPGEPGLYRISASGGEPEPVTELDRSRNETSHDWPFFLPDGRHFLFLARSADRGKSGIFVGSLDSPERKFVIDADSSMAYSPPGYLLFVRERTLMAQGFDTDTLELTGPAVPIVEPVAIRTANARAQFSVSQTGVLAYRTNLQGGTSQLKWFDRAGKQIGTVGEPGGYNYIRLSPDEKRVAVTRLDPENGNHDIWMVELTRPASSKFTFDPTSANQSPIWSPDGGRIVFSSSKEGVPNLYHKLSSGAASEEIFFRSDELKIPNDWSREGRYILYLSLSSTSLMDLWVLPLFGDQQPRPFLQTEFSESQGRFSRDGRWVAYVSNESGKNEVYVQNFPASGGKWQVSSGGGVEPHWRGDGKELFYVSPDKKLMAIEVNTGSAGFEVGTPKELFEMNVPNVGIRYDVTNDGQRFLVITLGEQPNVLSPVAVVVMNWTAELKR